MMVMVMTIIVVVIMEANYPGSTGRLIWPFRGREAENIRLWGAVVIHQLELEVLVGAAINRRCSDRLGSVPPPRCGNVHTSALLLLPLRLPIPIRRPAIFAINGAMTTVPLA